MQDKTIAFVDVSLVPMDKEQVLRNRTVIVRQDTIDQIAETDKITVPRDAVKIDGRGKYLMPGLADMHTHTWGEADFILFIANGVTTIRNMSNASYTATLLLDDLDRLTLFERVEQMGLTRYELVENTRESG